MSIGKTATLTFAFMLVADVAMAGGLSMIGAHGYIVDAGTAFGDQLGTHVDWAKFVNEGQFTFLEPGTLAEHGNHGHNHGQVTSLSSEFEGSTLDSNCHPHTDGTWSCEAHDHSQTPQVHNF